MVVRSGREYYSVAYQLPVKHCDCMLVRGEAEKPGQRLHRFRVLALGRARMADALHDFFLKGSTIFRIASNDRFQGTVHFVVLRFSG